MRTTAASQGENHESAVKAVEEIPYSDADINLETKQDNVTQYTKSEINRMSTAELQQLAFNNGVEDAYDMTGSALKQVLIEKFEL